MHPRADFLTRRALPANDLGENSPARGLAHANGPGGNVIGELTESQMDRLLRQQFVGRIGCHADGRTYVVPVTYVYDGKAIYGHTGQGLKVALMRRNPEVCFEVDHMRSITDWQSVIVQGRYEELAGEEAWRAVHLLTERLLPVAGGEGEGSEPRRHLSDVHVRAQANPPSIVYRIAIREKTGRFENG
jgi:nitroimidazol reductase NimA-like FMN-containing flavoprotein (pyridoxamine 5'-phosphate oxidase superfamily)